MSDGSRSIFIGRVPELQRLEARLRTASAGEAAAEVIGGEAGVGKSRLVAAFAEQARSAGCRILVGSCLDLGERGLPYAPFVAVFRALIRDVESASLAALLGPGRAELSRLLPELGVQAGAAAPLDETSPQAQSRLFELILGVLERLARSAPVLLVIEDIHWADQSTRDLLSFLVRVLRHSRVMFLITVRSDELHGQHPVLTYLAELERLEQVERIEVPPFGTAEVELQIRALYVPHPSDELVRMITERTDGNPFFVEQLLAVHAEALGRDMPPGLQDVLRARIAFLTENAQEVLRAASAAGSRVDDQLLATVLDLPGRDLRAALREAISRQLLIPVGDTSENPHDEFRHYEFRHSLLREVVYRELFPAERIRLHTAYAQALTKRAQDPGLAWLEQPAAAELAYHWDAARDFAHALPALVEAGKVAERVYAFGDAYRQYARALELWTRVPEPDAVLHADRASLLQLAAHAAGLSGEYMAAVELGREALAALPADADVGRLGWLHERLRWYLFESGDRAAAEAALGEAERLIPHEPPSGARAHVLAHRAGLDMYAGRYARSGAQAEAAVAVARAAGGRGQEAMALAILGWDVAMLGDIDEGLAHFRAALGIALEIGGVEGISLAYAGLAGLLDLVGRPREAIAMAREGYGRICDLGVERTYGGRLLAIEASALLELGLWDEAGEVTQRGLDRNPTAKSAIALHLQRARLDTGQGRYEEAATHLRDASLGDTDLGGTEFRRSILLARAELACWQGRLEDCRDAVTLGLSDVADGPPEPALGWLCAVGLRAEADAAERARPRHDERALGETKRIAHELAGRLAALASRAGGESITSDAGVAARLVALAALCRAELTRVDAVASPEAWRDVARLLDAIDQPYPAAYARYREAAAVLATRGPRPAAEAALRLAHEVARRTGAEPLRMEVEVLARQARLDLGPAGGPGGQNEGQGTDPDTRSPFAGLGLTAREREVLRLVAGGWTNQQIADHLFITRKTASVHVSNILGKLGVDSRVGAAAVAHRLGGPGAEHPLPPDAER